MRANQQGIIVQGTWVGGQSSEDTKEPLLAPTATAIADPMFVATAEPVGAAAVEAI